MHTVTYLDGAAPVSRVRPAAEVGDPNALGLELRVNGEVRQSSSTAAMLFPVAELIAYASSVFTLEPGDRVEAELESVAGARWVVAGRRSSFEAIPGP